MKRNILVVLVAVMMAACSGTDDQVPAPLEFESPIAGDWVIGMKGDIIPCWGTMSLAQVGDVIHDNNWPRVEVEGTYSCSHAETVDGQLQSKTWRGTVSGYHRVDGTFSLVFDSPEFSLRAGGQGTANILQGGDIQAAPWPANTVMMLRAARDLGTFVMLE